ncbi:cell division protein FtsA [Patescibacteria group bacterium]|nr:cell division protein FtsA [Patescibacteria group bacterium]MBU2579589.1 cell division protein FtsA [Patescibacteria group bacterium]
MTKDTIIVGLDVGTCFIRVIVAKAGAGQAKPQIIGVGQAPSFGLRKGVVVDIEETVKNISEAVQNAERSSGISIERVTVGVSGNHIISKTNKGVVAVSRADKEVSREDVNRAVNAASTISIAQNREILHVIPRCFSVDNQCGISDPTGMTGVRLDVDALLIEGAIPFMKNLTKCVTEAGLEIEEMVLAPLAASRAALNKRQKELGVLSLDLGGGTAGMTVFEEGNIIHSCVLPVGSAHITNDIAIGLRGSIDLAEKVKLEYGSALSAEISKKDNIDLSKLGLEEKGIIPRIEVVKIIEARMSEILELANKELKIIDRQGLLPAGIVFVGGGAKMPSLVDLAKDELKLPAQIGFPSEMEGVVDEVDDPAFATAVGLVLWSIDKRAKNGGWGLSSPGISIGGTVGKLKGWMRDFLP